MTFLRNFGIAIVALAWVMLPGGCKPTSSPPQINTDNAIIDALDTLRQAAEEKDPAVRSNAIEALAQTVGAREGGLYLQALSDPSTLVQFAAAMAIGDVKYEPAKGPLQKMAAVEGPDKRCYAGVIYALHELGDTSHTQDLARLMSHREAEVRAVTALVLGKLGEPSAIYMLKSRLGDEREARVELQLVESLAMLGDPYGKNILEAYTRRPFLDDRLVAIPAMARVRADHAIVVLTDLTQPKQALPVRVSAAGALARLGVYSEGNYKLCLQGAENPVELVRSNPWSRKDMPMSDVALIQRLGAISLGWMNRQPAVDVLHRMLRNEDGGIRVAAAMGILRIMAPTFTISSYGREQQPQAQVPKPVPATMAATAGLPTTATAPATATAPPTPPDTMPVPTPDAITPTPTPVPTPTPDTMPVPTPDTTTPTPTPDTTTPVPMPPDTMPVPTPDTMPLPTPDTTTPVPVPTPVPTPTPTPDTTTPTPTPDTTTPVPTPPDTITPIPTPIPTPPVPMPETTSAPATMPAATEPVIPDPQIIVIPARPKLQTSGPRD